MTGTRDGYVYRVRARSFVAGVVVNAAGTIVDAAPILGQWRRESLDDLRRYAASHGWTVERGAVEPVDRTFKPGYAHIPSNQRPPREAGSAA